MNVLKNYKSPNRCIYDIAIINIIGQKNKLIINEFLIIIVIQEKSAGQAA